ncbi:3-keto-L-gulonate-6-phosphate decarboxylase UlaD [Pectobacterium parmentieri]|uniref:3-dehydro-L-gulonate-6-phosphate decarboxylase n=1 Tax=Pectobacterium parmentieri TaxID=1905730 RepID=A0A0H3IAB6_PECPM|nr:3-keto-L-gulonate-6-phosphate decarboxylase UlaD [Pectobacterium parmentieri]AFI92102.1 3-keto-L-gulonate-6-phosphate decarboxylase ulaD [Pectobacterium parmentieri]AOR61537.1 3-keto-L-gulonate-6-phosphate decarboxylase [Pectobacterium parmentieri]AYH03017.1 3-dehydro-L-gulonate-6-phosphate decarboxylase UlaD [Pectobacterium parmentieri]AYH11804.1 3-dehydro-L-gulonate-6-phosphate decarboxylase UlaD [Pectobacterium parmentieri]AYH17475.1 3-dehydro-L-gulonate-6-phosphate decarboxylase UlaD [P
MTTQPRLQLALDHTRLDAALTTVELLHPYVDIIEAGTILCISAGIQAVSQLRERCPHHLLVADLKVADAGATLAEQAFSHGANWMTVICAAPLPTMASALEVAERHQGEIQIELFGRWTLEDAKAWRALGIKQAIYHRGRDAQASGQTWGQQDLDTMKALSDLDIELSITGGITPPDLPLFRDIAVTAFIAGRALADAPDPVNSARQFRAAIDAIWRP